MILLYKKFLYGTNGIWCQAQNGATGLETPLADVSLSCGHTVYEKCVAGPAAIFADGGCVKAIGAHGHGATCSKGVGSDYSRSTKQCHGGKLEKLWHYQLTAFNANM